MIQGRSNFVYRFALHRLDIYDAVLNFDFPIFISEGINEKIQNKSLSLLELIEIIKQNFSVKIDPIDPRKFQIGITPLNVDVNLVENDILNTEKFIRWREEYSNAKFLTEDEDKKYICGVEIEKMSKSKYNVVSPDDIIETHGADALRLYEMFLGPLELSKPWNTNGLSGTSTFIRRLWRLYHSKNQEEFFVSDEAPNKKELKSLHKLIKKVTEDIERFSFNTSVSNFMICVNELTDLKCNKRAVLEPLAILVSPYAPHIAEELWEKLGHRESITYANWPKHNEEYLTEDSFAYPISINGKTKTNLELLLTLSKEEVETEVLKAEEVKKYLHGQTPKKVIVVPGRIVNIVV